MRQKLRIAAFGIAILALIIVVAAVGVYLATQRVRPFYQQALQITPQALEDGNRELESRATALYNDARQTGRWQAVFSAEQINGWLAIRFAEIQEEQRTNEINGPRVAIDDDVITLGFRTRHGSFDTVVSADANVSLTDDGMIAVRLIAVRAGALPIPVMRVADEIAAVCRQMSLPVRWAQQGGEPVALIDIQEDMSTKGHRTTFDTVELRNSSLFVLGHTTADAPRNHAPAESVPVTERPISAQK